MTVESLVTSTSAATLRQLTERIVVCLGKLTADRIWARGTENENAVGNLVLHLAGNVRQWIVSGLGGAPDVRERDREFATAGGVAPEALISLLTSTIAEAAAIVENLSTEQLLRTYQIQNRSATGVEAVLKVTEHFAQHAGQIIYATKNLTGQDLGLVMPRSGTATASH
jgi:uncharacterized damage-inducible protein DinB